MNVSMKSRVIALLGAIALVAAAACADSATAPTVTGARAPRDTTVAGGDTSLCRSGFTVISGKVVCNEM
jgi:hypothetical protein